MSVFSTNQATQLYVVNACTPDNRKVVSTDTAGTIAVKTTDDEKYVYFEYMGTGGVTRSDLIEINNINYIKAVDADSMEHKLKSVQVSLDSNVNNGTPIAGQEYLLRVVFRQYVGMSDADLYFKYGTVHVTSGMSASTFYKKLAISLAKNMARETTKLVDIALSDGTIVSADTKEDTLSGTYTYITITEAVQDWVLGKIAQVPVYFEVQPTEVTSSGDNLIWGITEDVNSNKSIPNGTKIADLEYFCMGERGDIYRGKGYPHNITTKYLVDPTKRYDTINIHYTYIGNNESVQKSDKDIVLVVSRGEDDDNSLMNSLGNLISSSINIEIPGIEPEDDDNNNVTPPAPSTPPPGES